MARNVVQVPAQLRHFRNLTVETSLYHVLPQVYGLENDFRKIEKITCTFQNLNIYTSGGLKSATQLKRV